MSKQAKLPPSFPALVQSYFSEYLTNQRALSPQTIATYRDGFVLFLAFAEERLGRAPAAMVLADVTPELIMAFLDHLERQRHNSVRSRNARLAALRSFLKFAGHRDVASLQVIERDGMLLAKTRFLEVAPGETSHLAQVRFRTVGDATCTGCVESDAATPAAVIAEVSSTRITERGATRADDRISEAGMEDRKKEGYF